MSCPICSHSKNAKNVMAKGKFENLLMAVE